MWIKEFSIENIKCFEQQTLKLDQENTPYQWITFLSENGCGKSTILQSLGLLLAGPDSIPSLLPRPTGWLRDEKMAGKISIRVHQGPVDPGDFGEEKRRRVFAYSYHITGDRPVTIRNKTHTAPGVHENPDRALSWLRQNAFTSKGQGWFCAGYGPFRRLTRSHQIIVPTLEPQARHNNFISQFQEDEALAVFERWMVYLDYRIAKDGHEKDRRTLKYGIEAIDSLLPDDVYFDSISSEGRILYSVNGEKVPTLSLSDGYRSILAFAGDLVWRLLLAFPESKNPAHEQGVVLIDELDIHLHPLWQRDIALKLRRAFPKLQFIVTTHSPLVAAGAGEDALTVKISKGDKGATFHPVDDLHKLSVDKILTTEAFGLVSAYSPQTNEKMEQYSQLFNKPDKTRADKAALKKLQPQIKDLTSGPSGAQELDQRIDKLLASFIDDQA
ncbi:AAA family ATPase [Pseudomonas orientalis]|uniref:ATPase n=1 Tax=Pseudomonas orientalis TaxID=76758 RepID=A0A4Q7D7X0_9PSED|nr:AAA family ATPase [Pseudomonas orientalis]RZI32669.1 ATPase [Pseudomonas orientalis]